MRWKGFFSVVCCVKGGYGGVFYVMCRNCIVFVMVVDVVDVEVELGHVKFNSISVYERFSVAEVLVGCSEIV